MSGKDYYKILGVERSADERQLRKAFRKLARKYHPDLNPGNKAAEPRFKEINEAYEILSDPQKRSRYDTEGAGAFQPGFEGFRPYRTTTGGPGGDFSYGEADVGSVFENFFGDILGRRARVSPVKGDDLESPLEITLEEAFHGMTQELALQRHGKIERVSVKIPPGVADGTRVRLSGMGHPGVAGGAPGDLYVVMKIRSHPIFQRKGDDLSCEVPITISEAALGGKIEVPTLGGMASMSVPPGTQSGRRFRLKGKGMPHLKGGGTGDQYVETRIVIPTTIRPQDEPLFQQLGALYEENPRAHLKR
jgi:DnaJ-class molecular chaperone